MPFGQLDPPGEVNFRVLAGKEPGKRLFLVRVRGVLEDLQPECATSEAGEQLGPLRTCNSSNSEASSAVSTLTCATIRAGSAVL